MDALMVYRNQVGRMPANLFSGISGVSHWCKGLQWATSMPNSRQNIQLCTFLFRRNWISGYRKSHGGRSIQVMYSFYENSNVCRSVLIRSSPGDRTNCTYKQLVMLCSKKRKGVYYVLRTSKGLMSSDEALSKKIGGDLLMQILY
jgi:ribosomal protein S8